MEHRHICFSWSSDWASRTNRMASANFRFYPVPLIFCRDRPNRESTDQNQPDQMNRKNKFKIIWPVFF